MKTPKRIEPLVEDGLVDEVLRPLMSGKEAAVYVVRCGDELRCAKVYKEANKRSFRQASEYQEGRKVRGSRQARAMAKGSKYGRKEQEQAWQNAEVSALFRLASAGVRVPKPYDFLDGVLLMELVDDGEGDVAPRLRRRRGDPPARLSGAPPGAASAACRCRSPRASGTLPRVRPWSGSRPPRATGSRTPSNPG